jgi:AcrR family transcriptional regulator
VLGQLRAWLDAGDPVTDGRSVSVGSPWRRSVSAAACGPTRRAGHQNRDRTRAASSEGRKAETQARILDAAAGLFTTRGYERTSISLLAAQAGVSRAAIFWHFGSKAGLFEETCRRLLRPFFEEIRSSLQHLAPHKRLFELFASTRAVANTPGSRASCAGRSSRRRPGTLPAALRCGEFRLTTRWRSCS